MSSGLGPAANRARRLALAVEAERGIADRWLVRALRAASDTELERVRDLLAGGDSEAAERIVRDLAGRAEGEFADAVDRELRRRDPTGPRSANSVVLDAMSLAELNELITILRAGKPRPDGTVDLTAVAARRVAQFERRAKLRLVLGVDPARSCRRGVGGCECLSAALDALDGTERLRQLGLPALRSAARHFHKQQPEAR